MPIDQLGFTSHFINPSGIPIPMGFVFRFQVQTMNTFNYAKLLEREVTHSDCGGLQLVRREQPSSMSTLGARAVWQQINQEGGSTWCGIADWSNAVLVDFAHGMPGLVDCQPTAVVFLHQWFREVLEQTPPTAEALQQRLECVVSSGYLPVGPGEQVALLFKYASGTAGVEIYRCDDQGNAYIVHGYWFEAVQRWAEQSQRSVHDLNEKETRLEIESLTEAINQRSAASQNDSALMNRQLRILEGHLMVAPPKRTASGAVIRSWFIEGGTAHSINDLTRSEEGWKHYSTYEDAWYFSVRFNPNSLEIMTYAEQDVMLVICESEDQFKCELKAMASFYGTNRQPAAVGYDAQGGRTCFFDTLYLLQGSPKEVKLQGSCDLGDKGEVPQVPLFMAVDLLHPAFQGLVLHQEVNLPSDAFQLDLYNPLAFETCTAVAQLTAEGFDFKVTLAGRSFCGDLDLRVEQVVGVQ